MGSLSSGSLSYRPSVTAAERAIDFVYKHLPVWRDHPERETADSENRLTENLTNYLNDEARREEQPFSFFHQPSAGGRRTVDFSARQYSGASNSFARPAITVFETKRLPAPDSYRKMEYVIGADKPSGGIQRFKLGKKGHGSGHTVVAMVGYVQSEAPDEWLRTINSWINELAKKKPAGEISWHQRERLAKLQQNIETHMARAFSTHNRLDESSIMIHHLWVTMFLTYHSPRSSGR